MVQDKVPLRARLRQERNAMPWPEWQRRSLAVVEHLRGYFELNPAARVALYSPLVSRREADISALDPWLRGAGSRIAYPVLTDAHVGFAWVDDVSSLVTRSGFPQPEASSPTVLPGELDVLLVPALAATPSGFRLGYGAGYYDRVLPRFCPPAFSVCVIFETQLRTSLPVAPHDHACLAVVTDAGWVAR